MDEREVKRVETVWSCVFTWCWPHSSVNAMFGRGSLFQMLGDDFLRDPFFQDPLNHLFGNTGFLDPSQQRAPWSSAALPQRRGREVFPWPRVARHSSSVTPLCTTDTLTGCRYRLSPLVIQQLVLQHSQGLPLKRLKTATIARQMVSLLL